MKRGSIEVRYNEEHVNSSLGVLVVCACDCFFFLLRMVLLVTLDERVL